MLTKRKSPKKGFSKIEEVTLMWNVIPYTRSSLIRHLARNGERERATALAACYRGAARGAQSLQKKGKGKNS